MNPNGYLIQTACDRSGRSVPELAYQIKVQPAYLYTILSGKRRAGEKTLMRLVHEGLITLEEAFGDAA